LESGDAWRATRGLSLPAGGISQAVALLRERRASPEHRQLIERLDAVQDRVPDALDRARTRLHLGLHRAEISAADAREISGFWDEMAGHLTGGGLDELYGQIERRLAGFEQQVTDEGGFGQSPHSPLTTWQWILIGVLTGAGAAACLIFSGCSWIAAIFVGLFCLGGTVVNPTIAALCAGFTF
jgi:hypothetical protein